MHHHTEQEQAAFIYLVLKNGDCSLAILVALGVAHRGILAAQIAKEGRVRVSYHLPRTPFQKNSNKFFSE